MKTCTLCHAPKTITKFNRNKRRKDGFQNICRECSNQQSKKYYYRNREKHLQVVGTRRDTMRKVAQEWVKSFLSSKYCLDCGNDDWRVLEFDHVHETKIYGISVLIRGGYSVGALKKEAAKCEVVCKNCHALRTYQRMGSYRA